MKKIYKLCLLTFVLFTQIGAGLLQATTIPSYSNFTELEIEKDVDQLLLLLQKRLSIMHEVSKTKWNQNLDIEDTIREEQILSNLIKKATEYHIDSFWIHKFFKAQMEAAKAIQRMDFECFQKEGIQEFKNVYSLKKELRSYIDSINNEIILLLSKIPCDSQILKPFILNHPISIRATDFVYEEIWLISISPLID